VVPEAGSIEVRLTEVRDGVEIRVSDTGRGIPELIRSQLFEPFVSHGKENGTGLGLQWCKKLSRIMAGTSPSRNSPAGTVFRLLLPLGLSRENVSDRGEEGKSRTRLARTERRQPE